MVTILIDPGHQSRKNNEDPFPEEQGSLQGTPKAGDTVIEGGGPSGIKNHVLDGEICRYQGIYQSRAGNRNEDELPQDGGPDARKESTLLGRKSPGS